ncbi:hypothetical protein BJY00DRAFT_245611 [Aspergillus carlsbadensis]|nr:hypothetical protein BJY00DRAFT_245611 [Aspergillus carlsbadensis]
MEVTLEGSNSAETLPPWGGVIGLHRPVTGNLAVGLNDYFFLIFFFILFLMMYTNPYLRSLSDIIIFISGLTCPMVYFRWKLASSCKRISIGFYDFEIQLYHDAIPEMVVERAPSSSRVALASNPPCCNGHDLFTVSDLFSMASSYAYCHPPAQLHVINIAASLSYLSLADGQ